MSFLGQVPFFAGRLSYLPSLSLSIGTLKTSIPRSGAKGVCSSDSMTILQGRSRASCDRKQRTLSLRQLLLLRPQRKHRSRDLSSPMTCFSSRKGQ